MSPRTVSDVVRHTPQLIRTTDTVEAAVAKLNE